MLAGAVLRRVEVVADGVGYGIAGVLNRTLRSLTIGGQGQAQRCGQGGGNELAVKVTVRLDLPDVVAVRHAAGGDEQALAAIHVDLSDIGARRKVIGVFSGVQQRHLRVIRRHIDTAA